MPIVEDIKLLVEIGILVENKYIRGTLVGLCHDNLGGNTALGFVESFRANYYCRVCTMHRDQTQKATREISKLLRSNSEYNNFCKKNIN